MKEQLTEYQEKQLRLKCIEIAINKVDINKAKRTDDLNFIKNVISNIMNDNEIFHKENCYTKKQLISFGNYLLSDERKVTKEKNQVWDSDLANWEE